MRWTLPISGACYILGATAFADANDRTTVYFTEPSPFEKSRAYVKRSKNRPLDIILNLSNHEHSEDEDAIDGSAVAELQPDGNLTVRPRDSADPEATYPCPSNISKDEVKEILDIIIPETERWRHFELETDSYEYIYELLDRLGTGTFSSVYKALDKHYHSKWDNRAWHGHHPPASSAHYQSVRREGRVYVAMLVNTGEIIAAKQVDIPRTSSERRDARMIGTVEALKVESETLKDVDHPNIVQYLGIEETPTNLTVFLEYVPGGSIGGMLEKYGRFDEHLIKSFTSQVLDGLEYLHSKGIVHRVRHITLTTATRG